MFKISDIQGKKVLLRADLDLPLKDGRVDNNFRLQALVPTLTECLKYAQKTCLIGHLGRPEVQNDPSFSLVPVKEELERMINQPISLIPSGFTPGDWWKGESSLVMLDNLRYDPREESESPEFAHILASGADVYIYDAFATYRPCTSLSLIPEVLPTLTGLQFDKEISTLNKLLSNPNHPTLLIGSGAKPDKLALLNEIIPKFDTSFLGGVFASSENLASDGLDLSEKGLTEVLGLINNAQTIVLNGPLGKYEDGIHNLATKKVLEALTDPEKHTVLGGGDTVDAIPRLGFGYTQYGFVSTGGGAMLEYLLAGTHPLLAILKL